MPHSVTESGIPGLRTIIDLPEAESLWRASVPAETIFDLWEVRQAFQEQFKRPFRFLVGNTLDNRPVFLPLSWVEEKEVWCFFPGETWSYKTWLEQNRPLFGGLTRELLLSELKADFHLRYLTGGQGLPAAAVVDETGYLFHPAVYQFNIDNWWASFRHQRVKKLRKELTAFKARRTEIDHGEALDPFVWLVEMNLRHFGKSSYFADSRFCEGFRVMLAILARMGFLRFTTVTVDGTLAAVDFGSVYRGRYTLLAGGTDAQFTGVAKLINLHHMEWACRQRLDEVDFLCGDFSWKSLFHLTPRPLYLFTSVSAN